MAKTRMKTTPIRIPNISTSTTAVPTIKDVKKKSPPQSQMLRIGSSSIIVTTPPKRTNSMSSATSSISHASDATLSGHSDNESQPAFANEPTNETTHYNNPNINNNNNNNHSKISNVNELLSKLVSSASTNSAAFKNRKFYVVTEKCDDGNEAHAGVNASAGQKRKMYVLMEETTNNNNFIAKGNNEQDCWVDNNDVPPPPKKLTLFANETDADTVQIEKIIPELMTRIQAKDNKNVTQKPQELQMGQQQKQKQQLHAAPVRLSMTKNQNEANAQKTETINERLPITLPPKKNRLKIITTSNAENENANFYNNNNNNYNNSNIITNKSNTLYEPAANLSNIQSNDIGAIIHHTSPHFKQISAATPVIVSASSLKPHAQLQSTAAHSHSHAQTPQNPQPKLQSIKTIQVQSPAQLNKNSQRIGKEKNINLSTDFLFLMRMLPKLECIPEPHKSIVKTHIENVISEHLSIEEMTE